MQAQTAFVSRFQHGQLPTDMTELTFNSVGAGIAIGNLLRDAGLVSSTSEALRMINQGAVRIDGVKISNRSLIIMPGTSVYQVGKRRHAKITVT
jgi:tyrosyl-tRNA synthetase